MTTLGVRGAVPFTVGNVAMTMKGNAGWSHFFGDTEAKATMGLGGSGFATIKGGELKNQANVGLGIEAQLTKSATFGFSYTGTYDGDVTASGVSANLRIAFYVDALEDSFVSPQQILLVLFFPALCGG